jgi:hypothetical protein
MGKPNLIQPAESTPTVSLSSWRDFTGKGESHPFAFFEVLRYNRLQASPISPIFPLSIGRAKAAENFFIDFTANLVFTVIMSKFYLFSISLVNFTVGVLSLSGLLNLHNGIVCFCLVIVAHFFLCNQNNFTFSYPRPYLIISFLSK